MLLGDFRYSSNGCKIWLKKITFAKLAVNPTLLRFSSTFCAFLGKTLKSVCEPVFMGTFSIFGLRFSGEV